MWGRVGGWCAVACGRRRLVVVIFVVVFVSVVVVVVFVILVVVVALVVIVFAVVFVFVDFRFSSTKPKTLKTQMEIIDLGLLGGLTWTG